MTIKFFLNDSLVAQVANVTQAGTYTAAGAPGSVTLTTSYIDQRKDDGRDRDDFDWTLYTLTATPKAVYSFREFWMSSSRRNRTTPIGSPSSYGDWVSLSALEFTERSNPFTTHKIDETLAPYSHNIEGLFSGLHTEFFNYSTPSYAWRSQTEVTADELRVYFGRTYTSLPIRNGAGTGLLRGDTTPLPLVDI